MDSAITNTSPLQYLYRAAAIGWLPRLFATVWTPTAVIEELEEGRRRGYDVPTATDYPWLDVVDPQQMPSRWPATDLGPGELAAMALALENPSHIVILDDLLARRTASAAGLRVWGTLRVLIEAKNAGLTPNIAPVVRLLGENGMWISATVRKRILRLAGE